ncbi:MAG: amidohydrolase family protein [Pirellulaceae bacterium]
MSSAHPVSRRDVITAGLAAAALSAVPPLPVAAAEKEPAVDLKKHPYIDAHSHIWSPETDKWPLANGKTRADLDPPSFTPAELLKLAHSVGVGRVVLIQHTLYHGYDNTYLLDAAKSHPGVFAVTGMVNDTKPEPGKAMRELHKKGVKAFRITSRPGIGASGGEKWLSGPGMAEMWKTAAETGQVMACLIDAKDLPGVDAMCKKNPGTTVVIDHFARIGVDGTVHEEDLKQLCALAKHKKTYVKLSAYYALGKKKPPYLDLAPMIRGLLDAFTPDRCMWASDAPYQTQGDNTYQASIELIRDKLDFLSAGDKDKLLTKTAEGVYFTA